KISFKVASASGTVDQAVRTITNPFADHATRVDYYQLLRRWRVDLSRYGVRLTYDISIPEPGSEVLDKIVQINALAAALQQGFNAPDSTLPWARFEQANGQPLGPGDINRDNFMALAAQFGTAVETPPDEIVQFTRSYTAQIDTDAAGNRQWTSYQVDVPEGYEIVGVSLIPYWSDWLINDEVQDNTIFHIVTDLSTWFGDTGQVSFAVALQHIQAYEIELNVWFEWTNASFQAWQMRVWSQLYDAAKARYELNRTMLKDQLTALQEQLGAQDPLSLRQLEREEVMKNVLRWLFGPGFTFTPPGLPADLYKSNESIASSAIWSKVLAEGEIIKFLHHAIEWENMLYLLYPYFWSDTSRWELKRYLEHPDFMHRTFLRAGSARVILTIRPGFETDFVSFMDTGSLGGLAVNPPYLTIAQEMQAFAQTNYPNTPMANPDQSVRPLLTPRQRKAWDDMQAIMALLEKYKTDNGAYPGTQPGLAALAGLGPVPAKDPWGHAYDYKSPGIYADYELQSFGADGVAGGEDENADIVSWAEGSLVGRWYEFTPTSALDIAFNETMPTA
ncbi:MAG TPA: type II secretion system protein GspG, partial [Xanthobacteraceae bacterium]